MRAIPYQVRLERSCSAEFVGASVVPVSWLWRQSRSPVISSHCATQTHISHLVDHAMRRPSELLIKPMVVVVWEEGDKRSVCAQLKLIRERTRD